MKNKILKTLLAVSIGVNVGGFLYHKDKIEHYKYSVKHKNVMISNLQDNVKTKSTKIAKLGEIINLENEKITKQKKVIDNSYKEVMNLQKTVKNLQKQVNFKKQKEGSDVGSRKVTVEASAYIAMCREQCTGVTATGVNVSNTIYYKGYRVIAVDPSVIPLNSLVKVETNSGTFMAMAIDKGEAIKGNKIDILVKSTKEALNFGRQNAKLTILRDGEIN